MNERIGTPLATIAVDAANFSVTWQYTTFAMSMGPSQPVINDKNEVIGVTPQWAVTAQWSPQGVVQLHALLGHLIEQYERAFGKIPRPAVLFQGQDTKAESRGNVVTMGGMPVPAAAALRDVRFDPYDDKEQRRKSAADPGCAFCETPAECHATGCAYDPNNLSLA